MTVAAWLTLVIFWAGAVFALIYLRNAAFAAAETHIGNLTRVVAAETQVALSSAEAVLLELRDPVEKSDILDVTGMEGVLQSRAAHVPFLHSVQVVDGDGHLLHLPAQALLDRGFTAADGDWFAAQRDGGSRAMMIARPVHDRLTHRWSIPLSVRVEGAAHQFRGAVAAALDTSFLEAMFKELELGDGSSVTLERADNVLLLRQPVIERLLGVRLPDTAIYRALETEPAPIVHAVSVVDGRPKLVGARKVEGYPVFVVIALTETFILRTWHAQAAAILGTVTVLSFLLFAIMRQSDIAARLDAKTQAVRALVEASPRPLATLRRNDEGELAVEWANSHFAKLIGKAPSDLADKPLPELLARPGEPMVPIAIDGTKATRINSRRDGPDGTTETLLLFTPVKGGNDGTTLVTGLDLGARRSAARKEAERHLLEALGRMAGRVAHEINNVLQPIMSHASLALHACDGEEEALVHIREIQSGVRNGREIVRSVLSLAGAKAVVRQPKLLEAEVAAALDLIRPTIPPHIALETRLNAAGLTVLLGAGEIYQILGNLVTNAVDAIREGGTIRIEAEPHEVDLGQSAALGLTPGRFVRLLVADSGCGMDRETMLRALDPFFTTKPFGKGVGLGLSTVQTLVSTLEGGISLSSAPDQGTRISVLLPVQEMAC